MTEKEHQLFQDILRTARDITVVTNRADGWPHVGTVSFVTDGRVLYFGTPAGSQQTLNIARDGRVSITAVATTEAWREARSLSLAGEASFVTELGELSRVIELMIARYGSALARNGLIDMAQTRIVSVNPKTLLLPDCTKAGSGHTVNFKLAHGGYEARAA